MTRPTQFAGRSGFGARPALLVIDVNLGFTDPASPLVCDLDAPVAAIARLLERGRDAGLAIAYTTLAYGPGDQETAAAFLDKVPALRALEEGSAYVAIDPRIAPLPGERVFTKLFASAFFGTSLLSMLVVARADTLVVTGASTSGCVRATVVDALQYGLRPVVPREAVGDRSKAAHDAALDDIDQKYGDVMPVEDVLSRLTRYPER